MKRKEHVRLALGHQEGYVPLDLGATAVTGIHVSVVEEVRRRLGLPKGPIAVIEPYQMLGRVDADLQDALGVDAEGVVPRTTLFGFPNEAWKEWRTPWKQEVLVPGGFNTTTGTNGDILIHPQGDLDAPPSGRMPVSSFFFDSIPRQRPIDEEKLDYQDNVEEFTPIGEDDLCHFESKVEAAASTGRAVVATFGGTAIGDIALVPAPFLKHPKGIRDVEEWYVSTVSRPAYLHRVFSYQTEVALKNLDLIHRRVGDQVDVVFVCGTDFGHQNGIFCSPDTFESLYAPYYRRVNDWIHEKTKWKTFKHSCGAVAGLIPNFIESGFDILNPVQLSATGMDVELLKRRYGRRIVFWGGGVDTQKTLPFGTPKEVKAEVLERCRILSRGGGFVFNTIHNIQAGTPVENVLAMIDALREFNGEPGPRLRS